MMIRPNRTEMPGEGKKTLIDCNYKMRTGMNDTKKLLGIRIISVVPNYVLVHVSLNSLSVSLSSHFDV